MNLTFSAAVTYLVTHSTKPMKIPFVKEPTSLSTMQQKLTKAMHDMPIMNVFGKESVYDIHNPVSNTRTRAANTLSNILTLTSAGHLVMIPSVWIGAKVKAPMVRYLDRKHYGDEAMDDPALQARHAALDTEERPTLFGSVVGRMGTMAATQVVGYTIGNDLNLIRHAGKTLKVGALEKFNGLDELTGVLGKHSGRAIEEIAPNLTKTMDKTMADGRFKMDWSVNQKLHDPSLRSKPYSGSAQHMGKYLAQDVLYSAVTAVSISPVISFCKKFIPGMTYTPKGAMEVPAAPERAERAEPASTPQPASAPAPQQDGEKPTHRVQHAQAYERVAAHSNSAEVMA